jgi:hypothetical protein
MSGLGSNCDIASSPHHVHSSSQERTFIEARAKYLAIYRYSVSNPLPSLATEITLMTADTSDSLMRTAAFERVRRLSEIHDYLTTIELKPGFMFRGERIPLINPQQNAVRPQRP